MLKNCCLLFSLIVLFISNNDTSAQNYCPPGYSLRNVKCAGVITQKCVPTEHTKSAAWTIRWDPCPGTLSGGSEFFSSYQKAEDKAQDKINDRSVKDCPEGWLDKYNYIIFLDDGQYCQRPSQEGELGQGNNPVVGMTREQCWKHIHNGDQFFNSQKYEEAKIEYKKALEPGCEKDIVEERIKDAEEKQDEQSAQKNIDEGKQYKYNGDCIKANELFNTGLDKYQNAVNKYPYKYEKLQWKIMEVKRLIADCDQLIKENKSISQNNTPQTQNSNNRNNYNNNYTKTDNQNNQIDLIEYSRQQEEELARKRAAMEQSRQEYDDHTKKVADQWIKSINEKDNKTRKVGKTLFYIGLLFLPFAGLLAYVSVIAAIVLLCVFWTMWLAGFIMMIVGKKMN